MRFLLVAVVLLCACAETDPPMPSEPTVIPMGCPSIPVAREPFGGSCSEAAYPAVTICHAAGDGWCVDDSCRPQCANVPNGCPRCAFGEHEFTDRGACYCPG